MRAMKKRQRTLEVLVNLSLFVGLLVVLWHHRSNDNEGLLILLIGLGVTALINLAVFYWPRFGDPDYDADADDVERFQWEMVVLRSFVFLALWILTSWLARR